MLGGLGHDMPATLAQGQGEAANRQVVALRAAASENKLLWRTLQQIAHLSASLDKRLVSVVPIGMSAGRIAKMQREVGPHSFSHFRVHRRRRVIVQINSAT